MPCDSEMVTEYYKKCCDYSKNKVQLCCEKGYPKELEEKRDAACKAKDSKSCGKLAYIAHKQKDYEKSFKYAKKGCDNGKDNTSCVHLAYMYYYGQGVEKDYKKSFNLYEGLCERGIYSMCPILSHFYTDGVGMKQDIKKGKEILEKLCYDKYPEDCANLAALYESDKYGMKDDKKATELYTMACKHNPKGPACDKIGGMSKRLEFFVPNKRTIMIVFSWQILITETIWKKSCFFITKLAHLEIQAPATGLLVSPSKKKLQKNKNLLAKKKMTEKLASR